MTTTSTSTSSATYTFSYFVSVTNIGSIGSFREIRWDIGQDHIAALGINVSVGWGPALWIDGEKINLLRIV